MRGYYICKRHQLSFIGISKGRTCSRCNLKIKFFEYIEIKVRRSYSSGYPPAPIWMKFTMTCILLYRKIREAFYNVIYGNSRHHCTDGDGCEFRGTPGDDYQYR